MGVLQLQCQRRTELLVTFISKHQRASQDVPEHQMNSHACIDGPDVACFKVPINSDTLNLRFPEEGDYGTVITHLRSLHFGAHLHVFAHSPKPRVLQSPGLFSNKSAVNVETSTAACGRVSVIPLITDYSTGVRTIRMVRKSPSDPFGIQVSAGAQGLEVSRIVSGSPSEGCFIVHDIILE